MVKKKFFKLVGVPVLGIISFLSLSSFVGENESSGGNCDLCIVKSHKKNLHTGAYEEYIVYSCKKTANENKCSKTIDITGSNGVVTGTTVTCNNATAC